ncbi:MAG: hypothetical protein KVP17_001190 [Porospora cf. gigantea B]|uniref:uncharacterized protein n=1 Tax=Porospora cf. gigantea B TaxID=2853592 RepID=UPI0035718F0C|nr:MAG: hypothetical protein KVP17_001190 [Porospora cf. gigantea B]
MLVRVSVTAYYVLILAACFSLVSVAVASVHMAVLRSPKKRQWLAMTHGLGATLLNWLSKPLWGCRITTSPLLHSQLSLDMEADASIRQEVLRQLIEPSKVRSPILSRGRFIMMCNHLSNLDGIILRGLLRPIAPLIVYKSSLHYVPLLGMNLYLTGDFPVYFTRENGGWKTAPGSAKQLLQNMKTALDENVGFTPSTQTDSRVSFS